MAHSLRAATAELNMHGTTQQRTEKNSYSTVHTCMTSDVSRQACSKPPIPSHTHSEKGASPAKKNKKYQLRMTALVDVLRDEASVPGTQPLLKA